MRSKLSAISFLFLFILLFHGRALTQNLVHVGISSNWDYGIGMPSGSSYQPYASGQVSAFSFDFQVGIPLGPFQITPTFSTSLPLRTLLLHNVNGENVPNGYSLSMPYSSGSDFNYYVYSDDYESDQSTADIYQNLFGTYLTFNFGSDIDHINLGSGFFVRKKKAFIYTPILYDEYEWYGSTGTEFDNYFYSDTYYEPQSQVETLKETTIAIPLTFQYCHHWGRMYASTSFVYFLEQDPWMSFRYAMGVAF